MMGKKIPERFEFTRANELPPGFEFTMAIEVFSHFSIDK